ncbi:MAG TPA: hypothetical protein VGD56_15610 [Gemmatirosa sp.]
MQRDTPGSDLPRLVAILDALLAWSAERPTRVAFRGDAGPPDVIAFARVGESGVCWAIRHTRGGAPTLELAPPAGRWLTDAGRAHALATLNAHSREVRADGDRLRIGFGALKNADALAAVLALLDALLDADTRATPPAAAPSPVPPHDPASC